MKFHTRKWVKPEDLNANQTLFGGKVLAWVDEEAALYSIIQLENKRIVTKYMSEINRKLPTLFIVRNLMSCNSKVFSSKSYQLY